MGGSGADAEPWEMRGIWLLVLRQRTDVRHAPRCGQPWFLKLSPIGLLWVSCLLASVGLFALSIANSPVTGLLAATVWGTGVCYMWPTMLATAAERFPQLPC